MAEQKTLITEDEYLSVEEFDNIFLGERDVEFAYGGKVHKLKVKIIDPIMTLLQTGDLAMTRSFRDLKAKADETEEERDDRVKESFEMLIEEQIREIKLKKQVILEGVIKPKMTPEMVDRLPSYIVDKLYAEVSGEVAANSVIQRFRQEQQRQQDKETADEA